MKYSVIIVAYKAFDYLEKCIKSIRASAIQDYEIIVVDNTERPKEIQPDLDGRPLAESIVLGMADTVYYPDKNIGFAAGCNAGATRAKGAILIFLNPDTEVYGAWADEMAKYLAEEGVGAVGPISDFVAGMQRMDLHLEPKATPAETAAWAAEHLEGQGQETKLIIGLCLMIPRTVWDCVQGMDPKLFLGNDDLELSWRLREASYRLIIARDVFVHHAGHKSMESRPRPEIAKLLEESETHLHGKLLDYYNGEPPSAVDLWGVDFFYTGPARRLTLSVVMIVRNEADKVLLPINDMGSCADECIVVDTGSDDATINHLKTRMVEGRASGFHEPGEALGPDTGRNPALKLYRFPWVDDFAAARNFAKSKATGDYLLWLDADDRVPAETARLIRQGLDNPSRRMLQRRVYFDLRLVNTADGRPQGESLFQPRILPNLPEIQWEGAIHESPMPSILRLRRWRTLDRIAAVDMTIIHTGYDSHELRAQKTARNLRMLEAQPDTPQKYMDMANAYASIEKWTEAGALYRWLLCRWEPHLEAHFRDHIRYQVGVALYRAKAWKEALSWFGKSSKQDATFMIGDCLEHLGGDGGAFYRAYLAQTPDANPFGSHRVVMAAEAREKLKESPLG
jgi:GT2 family glycosyltransferase